MIHCQMCKDFDGKFVTSDGLILCEAHIDMYRDGQLNPNATSEPYSKADYDCMNCYQRDASTHIIFPDTDAFDPYMVCGACMAAFVAGQAHPSSTLSAIVGFVSLGRRPTDANFPNGLSVRSMMEATQ